MSQDELAEKLHIENRASISSYETNRRLVSGAVVVEIANVLGSSTDYILNGTESEDSFIEEVNELIAALDQIKLRK